jgi:hypothetical protein
MNHLLQFFTSEHLPEHLKNVSNWFCDLADRITVELPEGPEEGSQNNTNNGYGDGDGSGYGSGDGDGDGSGYGSGDGYGW